MLLPDQRAELENDTLSLEKSKERLTYLKEHKPASQEIQELEKKIEKLIENIQFLKALAKITIRRPTAFQPRLPFIEKMAYAHRHLPVARRILFSILSVKMATKKQPFLNKYPLAPHQQQVKATKVPQIYMDHGLSRIKPTMVIIQNTFDRPEAISLRDKNAKTAAIHIRSAA